MYFITRAMAARFEAVASELARRCACESLDIAGGVAAFAGVGSPLTHAAGLAMNAPVCEDDLDRVEAWYRERGSAIAIEVCPLADPSLLCALGRRGYLISEVTNFLVRRIVPGEVPPAPPVEVRPETDSHAWSATLARGFFEHDPLPGEMDIGLRLFHAAGFRAFTALFDGAVAGGGAMAIADRIACFCADATLPACRIRGVQSSLIRARLTHAIDAECELAFAEAAPATMSHRNYQRHGFEAAWTKLTFVRE